MKINRTYSRRAVVVVVVVFNNRVRVCLPVLVPEIVASSWRRKTGEPKLTQTIGDELLIPTRLFERS